MNSHSKHIPIVLVAYDLSTQKLRNKMIQLLHAFGLHRIQLSVFCGRLDRNQIQRLKKRVDALLLQDQSPQGRFILTLLNSHSPETALIHHVSDKRTTLTHPQTAFKPLTALDLYL